MTDYIYTWNPLHISARAKICNLFTSEGKLLLIIFVPGLTTEDSVLVSFFLASTARTIMT